MEEMKLAILDKHAHSNFSSNNEEYMSFCFLELRG